jgi:hypothetical protein
MPKINYKQAPNKTYELLPEGDYLVEIVSGEPGLSQANKYRGADQFELKFEVKEPAKAVGSTFMDWLTFHPDLDWKVDNFLTCFNYGAKAGEEVEVTLEQCIGLRGLVKVTQYEKNGKKYNQIAVYYTDKEKFSRAVIEPEDVPAAAATSNSNDPWA